MSILRQQLKALSRDEIDDDLWNDTIRQSIYPKIYGFTWYLDAITDRSWSALVFGNYDVIMALFMRSKYKIKYVTQPYICQTMGTFGATVPSREQTKLIIEYFKKNFYKTDIFVNESFHPHDELNRRVNHSLLLDKDYAAIRQNFSSNTIRNLKNAAKYPHTIDEVTDIDTFISFVIQHDKSGVLKAVTQKIRNLIKACQQNATGKIITVRSNDQIMSTVFLAEDENRIYTLIMVSNEAGLHQKSMFFLLDHIIQKYAGSGKILDFFGSNMPNIARRNEGFGAVPELYYHLKCRWTMF